MIIQFATLFLLDFFLVFILLHDTLHYGIKNVYVTLIKFKFFKWDRGSGGIQNFTSCENDCYITLPLYLVLFSQIYLMNEIKMVPGNCYTAAKYFKLYTCI